VTLDGRASTAPDGVLDFAVAADVARLGELLPDAVGAVALTAQVTGTRSTPRVAGSARARALEFSGVTVDALELAGDAGLGPNDPIDLALTARGVRRGTVDLEEVRVDAAGTATAHRLDVAARRDNLGAVLAASGGIASKRWTGVLEDVRLDEALGDWRLLEPAPLAFAPARTTLGTTCLIHESGARGCVELTLEGRPEDRVLVSVQNIDLGSLAPVLPPELSIEGIYQLSASFTDPTGDPRGALALTGGTTRLTLDMGEQDPFTTELYGLIVSATLADGRLALSGSVEDNADGSVELVAAVDNVMTRDSPISGRVQIQWPDLAVVSLLSPDVGEVGGVLTVDLVAGGTVDAPEIEGRAGLRDGRLGVPAWGLTVTGIDADAMSADGRALDFTATGIVGDGSVRVAGRTELDPAAGWPTRLTLQGSEIRAVQLADAEVFVSPDLTARIELPDIVVTGNVHVPRARIEISALPEQAIAPSRDAVVHDRESDRLVRPLRLRADIDLTLGENVDYSGLNLTTDVTGRLNLRVEDRATTATGELTLIGTYNAYGQVLELERGELNFSGPLNDPGLDVRAVRTVDDKRVGVELAGSLKQPRTRIFSTPAMSEADALSYLLLGRPLHGTGGGEETATLQAAALSMGLQQALPVVQRIGQTIGLDELTVQTTTADAGELQAGKYLSPRLYIRYSYGLFNRIGGLLLRFKVNDRLSIETQSGDQQSMDLLYTVEKD
jgi:translocation and assembly module TamB